MSKNSSVKYYQKNKGGLQNKARERYQTLSKEEEEKKKQSHKIVVDVTKISRKMKKNKLVDCRKKYYRI